MFKKWIVIIAILLLIFVIGTFGISRKVNLKYGNCEGSYEHYYIIPFISDTNCLGRVPSCTYGERYISSAKRSILQCLCKSANEEVIFNYYNSEYEPGRYGRDSKYTDFSGNVTETICQYVFRTYYDE